MLEKNHRSWNWGIGSASRRPGGRTHSPTGRGSKKKVTPGSEIESNLLSLTKTRTAGDPDDEQIIYTDLTPARLEQELAAMQTPVSDDVIRQWMDDQGLRLRKIHKVLAGGSSPDRDAQFNHIADLIQQCEWPTIPVTVPSTTSSNDASFPI